MRSPSLSLVLLLLLLLLTICPYVVAVSLSLRKLSFLKSSYGVKHSRKQQFVIRQVPGDGSCLFHALSAWQLFIATHEHKPFDNSFLSLSQNLRELSVKILRSDNSTRLALEGDEEIDAPSLVEAIAAHYNTTPSEYCDSMLKKETWGGGPEIAALCNHFKRPIFVYELCTSGLPFCKSFKLTPFAQFGFPRFKNKSPIHILSADGRFPNIRPGKHQTPGNHFLAMFPCDSHDEIVCDGVEYSSTCPQWP